MCHVKTLLVYRSRSDSTFDRHCAMFKTRYPKIGLRVRNPGLSRPFPQQDVIDITVFHTAAEVAVQITLQVLTEQLAFGDVCLDVRGGDLVGEEDLKSPK